MTVTAQQIVLVIIGLAFLIGGPIWITGNIRSRQKARQLAKWSSEAIELRQQNADELGERLVEELGPLDDEEMRGFLLVTASIAAVYGSVSAGQMRVAADTSRAAFREARSAEGAAEPPVI